MQIDWWKAKILVMDSKWRFLDLMHWWWTSTFRQNKWTRKQFLVSLFKWCGHSHNVWQTLCCSCYVFSVLLLLGTNYSTGNYWHFYCTIKTLEWAPVVDNRDSEKCGKLRKLILNILINNLVSGIKFYMDILYLWRVCDNACVFFCGIGHLDFGLLKYFFIHDNK